MSVIDTKDTAPRPEGCAYAPCMPSLPDGCTAQPGAGFFDSTGRLFYEFHAVYKPRVRLLDGAMKTLAVLDQELSFWAVTWGRLHESGDELPDGRWINYGQVRKQQTPRMTFQQFSQLREEVSALLPVQD